MLTQEETKQLIKLLQKASPRDNVAGSYNLLVSPIVVNVGSGDSTRSVYLDNDLNKHVGTCAVPTPHISSALHQAAVKHFGASGSDTRGVSVGKKDKS